MDPLYEADVLRVFGKFVENGLVDRRFMTGKIDNERKEEKKRREKEIEQKPT